MISILYRIKVVDQSVSDGVRFFELPATSHALPRVGDLVMIGNNWADIVHDATVCNSLVKVSACVHGIRPCRVLLDNGQVFSADVVVYMHGYGITADELLKAGFNETGPVLRLA